MKNKLSDLNNHLFAQLERLGDEEISEEVLEQEIKRAKAITGVASTIVSNGRLALDVIQFQSHYEGRRTDKLPDLLKIETENKIQEN